MDRNWRRLSCPSRKQKVYSYLPVCCICRVFLNLLSRPFHPKKYSILEPMHYQRVSVIITTEALSVLCRSNELTLRKVTFSGLTFSPVPPFRPFKLMLMGIPGVPPQTFYETQTNFQNQTLGWQTKVHLILIQYHELNVTTANTKKVRSLHGTKIDIRDF